ncbi:Uu.00g022900.m01.CDS01 [Anthostomella pinea]|uniref:Sensitive to high expression protein 9, mitochondrial n=1 Tax=Anthostomella pinea TaxID=933095 RepID=A0AAI8VU33_9PEZI|nr:Uu.00g022900.m01.CDS01 [Anthostomella pinea]
MSTPRALKPLIGASSRLIIDQLAPRSASRVSRKLVARPSATTAPPSICLSCRYSFAVTRQQQLRSYSSSPKPPSHDDGVTKPKPNRQDDGPPPFPFPSTFASFQEQDGNPPSPEQQQPPQPQPPPPEQQQPSDQPRPLRPSDPSLPSTLNSQRSQLTHSLSAFMDRAQSSLFAASRSLNDLTGYSSIETLKSQISALEASLSAAQQTLISARSAYKTAVAERSATQREVTTLLARQKTWTPADFERFTSLYRQDYELEADVTRTAGELEDAEREAERLGRELSAGILGRYHEEQIWSDKIRRMSTWGTWGLMGVNVLLFLVLQFGAEPWRRRRLVRGFEEKVREAIAEERAKQGEVGAQGKGSAAATTATTTATTTAAMAPVEGGEVIGELSADDAAATVAAEPITVDAPGSEQAGADATIVEPTTPESATEPVLSPAEAMPAEPPISWRETLTEPSRWKLALVDLYSDRTIAIRMCDASLIALEAAVAGAVVAGAIAALFVRRS